jgi:pimeloyl-ACP methyl ester carboxylesterase
MRGYVDTSIGQIHYLREGSDGPDLVLVHDEVFSSNLYERALPLLGTRMRAWAFDAPGAGWSDGPAQPTVPEIAGCLLEALDRLGIRRPVVAGYHVGCVIVAQMLELGGASTCAGAVLSGVGSAERGAKVDGPEALRPDTSATQWHQAVESYRTTYLASDQPSDEDAWVQHLYSLSAMSRLVPRRVPWPAGWDGFDHVASVRSFPGPVLVVNGADDPLAGADVELAGTRPKTTLRVVDGIGGHLMLRAPERYAEAISAFVEENQLSDVRSRSG